MNEQIPPVLQQFLHTDPADVGCDEALRMLHVYAELVATAPGDAATRYPGIAQHLAACGPCGEDFDGLLAAITASDDAIPVPGPTNG